MKLLASSSDRKGNQWYRASLICIRAYAHTLITSGNFKRKPDRTTLSLHKKLKLLRGQKQETSIKVGQIPAACNFTWIQEYPCDMRAFSVWYLTCCGNTGNIFFSV